jgi:hypothetical protein
MNEQSIHYDDLPCIQPDVLLELRHDEIESYIRESRAIIDNATMVYDRLRAVRLEKLRRECIENGASE